MEDSIVEEVNSSAASLEKNEVPSRVRFSWGETCSAIVVSFI